MSPPFIFRIDEIGEDPNAPVIVENPTVYQLADWKPSLGTIRAIGGGVGGRWWHCDGRQIREISHSQFPGNAVPFQTFSMFYGNGFGFWVYRGDATRPNAESTFQPLRFEHDRDDGYSSYLSDSADERALLCRREDQAWPKMLLPDIYHGHTVTPYPQYGALKGDLGILLGLIAFSTKADHLQNILPVIFSDEAWQAYYMEHGRTHQRGVVVYIYTCPPNYPSRNSHGSRGSTVNDLRNYERGVYGKYYN